jgi:tetratricopeptide (TPR) repeat protein
VLGEDHPDTLDTMNSLAILYKNMGRYDEAEKLFLETIEKRRAVLGPEHQSTRGSIKELIELYEIQGKTQEAEKWRAELPEDEGMDNQ